MRPSAHAAGPDGALGHYRYAMATSTRISRWGTRDGVDVRL
ncbi:hypothetical protein ACPA54_31135 [Uniformispora flossi]